METYDPGQARSPSRAPDAEARSADGVEELSLWDFIDPLVASWPLIVGIVLLGAVVAYTTAQLQRPMYEASAVARIAESKTGDVVEVARPENFRPLLENRAIVAEIVREFDLRSASPWRFSSAASGPFAPADFLRDRVTVEQVAGTNLLRVRVRHENPETAAKVANALVERGLALNRRLNQQEVVESRDYIKSQLDQAAGRVETLKGQLLAAKTGSQVDALKADTEGALDLRAKLMELDASIEYERAFLAASEAELKSARQLVTTRRSIDRDPALMEAAKGQAPGAAVLGLELSEEQVNEAYSKLQEQIAESRAKLAGQERQRRMLVDDRRLNGARLPALSKLYESEVAIARLEAEYEMALKLYTDLAARYEDARLRVGSRGAQLQVLDPAVTPTGRASPRVAALTQIGAVLGLLLACLLVLGRHFYRRRYAGH